MRKWFVGALLLSVLLVLASPQARRVVAQVIPCTYGFVSGTSFCAGTPVPLATPTTTAGPTAAATALPSPTSVATDLKAPQIRQTTLFAPSASNGVVPFVLPTTPAYADILVAAITISLSNDSGRTIQPPPGWQTLDPLTSSTFNALTSMQTFYHVVYGADNGSYTFYELAPSGQLYAASGVLYDIYGEDPANPIGTHAIGINYNSSIYLPGVSYSRPSSLHELTLGFWGMDGGSSVANESIVLGAASSPFVIDNFANAIGRATISAHAQNISTSTTPYTVASITNNQPYVTAVDNIQPIGANAAPTPTPTPSPVPSFSPSPTPTPSISPTPVPTSSVGPSPNASGQLSDTFSSDAVGTTPNLVQTVNYNSGGPTQWQIYNLTGTNVFGEPSGGAAQDIAYYNVPTQLASISESYSFVYSGPSSVVEPFLVTSKSPFAGWNINLSASFVGNYVAGAVTNYNSSTGTTSYSKLKTEPYYYQLGHTYRVDVVGDQTTSVLSARVYDLTTGQQSTVFDQEDTIVSSGFAVYPGIWNPSGGATIVDDVQFGPSGNLLPFAHPARSAYSFNDYQGMNAASTSGAGTIQQASSVLYLPQTRIKHLRASALTTFESTQNAIESAATALGVNNYSVDQTCLVSYTTTAAYIQNTLAPTQNNGGCESLELPNEPNQGGPDPNYNTDIPDQAACFSQAIAAGNLPTVKSIWGPSLIGNQPVYANMNAVIQANPTPNPANTALPECPQPSPIGAYITATNTHSYEYAGTHLPEAVAGVTSGVVGHIAIASPIPYPSGCGSSFQEDCGYSYGINNYDNFSKSLVGPNEPMVSTEGAASYGASLNQTICPSADVDLNTQQAYTQRGILYNYNIGHLRIYPFNFGDFGVGPYGNPCNNLFNSYGFLQVFNNPDGSVQSISPKQSFTGLAYFNQLVFDTGTGASTYSPSPLTYALTGVTPDILTTLLQESDGSYRLIVWSDNSLCSEPPVSPCTPIAPTSTTLTLKLATSATVEKFQQVYGAVGVPGSGVFNLAATLTGTSISLTNITPYPTVLAIYPSGVSATPIPLPSGISTPSGVYETTTPATPAPVASPTTFYDNFAADPVGTQAPNWVGSEAISPWAVSTYAPYSSANSYGDSIGEGETYGAYSFLNLYYATQVEEKIIFKATTTTNAPLNLGFVGGSPSSYLWLNLANGQINLAYYSSGLQNAQFATLPSGARGTYVIGTTYEAKAQITTSLANNTLQLEVWNIASPEPTYPAAYTITSNYLKGGVAPLVKMLSPTAPPAAIGAISAGYNTAAPGIPSVTTTPTPIPTASPTPSPGPT